MCKPFMAGSLLRDDFDSIESDMDFSVEFQPMTPHDHAESYSGLLASLDELFAQRVDLVEVEAIRNPYLRREIVDTGVVI